MVHVFFFFFFFNLNVRETKEKQRLINGPSLLKPKGPNSSQKPTMKTIQPLQLVPHHARRTPYKANPQKDFKIGLLIIVATWLIFVVGVGAVLDIWTIRNTLFQCVQEGETDEYSDPIDDFPIQNYYSMAILLVPVAYWIWSVGSWTALKLFKHSKGVNVRRPY